MKLRQLLGLCLDNAHDLDVEVMVDVRGVAVPTLGVKTGRFLGPEKAGEHYVLIQGTEAWNADGRLLVE